MKSITCSGGCGKVCTGEGSFESIAAVNNLIKVGVFYYCASCYARMSGKAVNDAKRLSEKGAEVKTIDAMKSESEGIFSNEKKK